MLSPDDCQAAQHGAAAELRLRIERIEIGPDQPAQCWLTGVVTLLRRDHDGRLKPGETIILRIDSRHREQRCPPGDDLRLCIEELVPGVSVHAWVDPVDLEARPPIHGVVMGQARLVDDSSVRVLDGTACGQPCHEAGPQAGPEATSTTPLWAFPGGLKALDLPTAQAFRRMLACFIHWLAARGGLAGDAELTRWTLLQQLTEASVDAAAIIEALDDELRSDDVTTTFRPFAGRYLEWSGGFSNDYWRFFVEQADRLDLTEVQPDSAGITAFGHWIDQRWQQFQAQSSALWEPLVASVGTETDHAWTGQSRTQWLADVVRRTDELATARPSQHRRRLDAYWAVIDAAVRFPDATVVSALALTWLRIDDVGVQQAVYRALAHFSDEILVSGLLPVLPLFGPETTATIELVSALVKPRQADEVTRLGELLRSFPREQSEALLAALERVGIDGDDEVADLLVQLRPARDDGDP